MLISSYEEQEFLIEINAFHIAYKNAGHLFK